MIFTTVDTYNKWEEIKEYFDLFVSDWVFRGQRDSTWGLQTSLERATTRVPNQLAEQVVYRSFTRSAHNYLQLHEMPTNLLEWFALMQHHGAPTRLLDWTTSPYVACFFAVEEATEPNGNSVVWALDASWCGVQGRDVIRRCLSNDPTFSGFKVPARASWDESQFRRIFYDEKLPVVMPMEPYRRNTRLTIQNGLFMCPGDPNKGFEGNFDEYDVTDMPKHVLKIVIPNGLRPKILADLNYMNVNRATLFPGIDGFAQSMRQAILGIEDHGQIGERTQKRMAHGFPFR